MPGGWRGDTSSRGMVLHDDGTDGMARVRIMMVDVSPGIACLAVVTEYSAS